MIKVELGPRELIERYRWSHERLDRYLDLLPTDAFAAPSYCDDWSVGRVLGHLGSGAELALATVTAARDAGPPPDDETRQAIWDRYDAMTDADAAGAYRDANRALVDAFESLGEADLAQLRVASPFGEIDLAGFLAMRLAEHAMHSWDVVVARERDVEIPEDAVEAVMAVVRPFVARAADADVVADLGTFTLAADLVRPSTNFVLRGNGGVSLEAGADADVTATLSGPAGAFARLLFGRLDAEHTPADLQVDGPVGLDDLRRVFPGF